MQTKHSQSLILSCLNKLQTIKSKLTHLLPSSQPSQQLAQAIRDIKMYLQTMQINRDIFQDMQQEVLRLRKENQDGEERYRSVLENLEMLVYQKEYEELKKRIGQFKNGEFNEPLSPFTPRITKQSSGESGRLDRAFVFQQSEDQQNQFLSCIKTTERQDSIARKALDIINSSSPFEKKQEVWLEIMYSKNMDQVAQLSHVTEKEVINAKRQHKETSEFELNYTEENDPMVTRRSQLHCFSGKKIKSMILLKEKSSKKKSKVKTSVKKAIEGQSKEKENAEQDHLNVRHRKKLDFASKIPETSDKESIRKKISRNSDVKTVKSFRKTLINNL